MRFIHTADWHVGKPFGQVEDPEKRIRLQQERIAAIRRLGALVRETQAAFVVVAGDIFDTPSPSRTTVADAFAAIGAIPVPVYAIPGNHDHGGVGSIWEQGFLREEQARLAPNLHLIIDSAPVTVERLAVILPCPMARRHQAGDPTLWLRDSAAYSGLPADLPRIVLAHGSVQGFSSSADADDIAVPTNQLDLSRLPAAEIDYVALGDWHGTKQVAANAWYAGTPEQDRFAKGGLNDPGNALLVEITSRQAGPNVASHRTSRLGWHEWAFSFGSDASLEQFTSECDRLLDGRAGEDLLNLGLGGTLSFTQSGRYEAYIESLRARLLRLRIEGEIRFVPSDEELARLQNDPDNPLVASVARRLAEESQSGD